ncbi:type II secretion system protein GspM [Sulfitobacter sp. F26204]|uniref:type II secretion system protein GspM n=1 Tax=Sulfitobacter sp. F26204 TaxID=2996014 RepID=UPI00225E3277|nr:type II secretion system protein GspM [Sulfitobacter sp. F26204]MCX7560526.1 type II secretion system protein GspM [Sulfitobacter sp. F26204]
MRAFRNLTLREQIMVSCGGAILVVLALWYYVWQPVMSDRSLQADRIARYLTILDIARTTREDAPRKVVSTPSSTPLAPLVTQSAQAAGIPLSRLDPEGARLRVTVAKLGYNEATTWIANLESASGLRLLSVEMTRLTEPAQVSLRMTLEQAQ